MKRFSFLIIVAIASLFICNSVVAQITIVRTIDNPSASNIFLGSANMDNDPQQELVYGDWDGAGATMSSLLIIDGATGNIEWEKPTSITRVFIAGHNAADAGTNPFCDINNDGIKEITFRGYENGIFKIFIVGLQGTNAVISNNALPNDITLLQNYPNPFNPTTTIEYQIQRSDFVTIKIFDSIGKLIKNLINEEKQSGEYSVIFDGKNDAGQKVSSGVYFYQLQVGDFISNKKMILLK
ncbi:MAG: hypothetical protein CVU92_03435 [Firmicutes bacterium HGW-Firmicutes-17]|nr:MAG: hypothetical protein CVU92_03435 [Firmicutes bacterium HGW-Firmicutes-17]